MSSTISLFQRFRIKQPRMMVLSTIHGLRPNAVLILLACALVGLYPGFPQPLFEGIFLSQLCIYPEHPHHHGATQILYWVCHAYLQLSNDNLVQGELARRFWREHQNLYVWAPIPLFVRRADYRCLELALIQEWQPWLNYPFICQFFHPREELLKKRTMNTK